MKNGHKSTQVVQSLDRALNLLEKLVEAEEPVGVTELSQSLSLHKSTVHRLLSTLCYRGYVEQDVKSNNYTVGLKLFEIGSSVLHKMDLRSKVKPYLEELMRETKETIHLGILDDYEVVYIDKVESSEVIRMYSKIGRRVPTHCTSLGKILLAYSPEEVTDQMIEQKELTYYTETTITDPVELKKHLEMVKEQGYSIDDEEQERDIRCIAGPVFDYDGKIMAAFSISGPVTRMTEERVQKLSQLVVDYSGRISASFGYKK
ncbi:MAG: IclR family transcriptional regulator [Halanaerobiales bacterium]|nr:IclR family transcriptional regulator [Halanaerobiales bacterium]